MLSMQTSVNKKITQCKCQLSYNLDYVIKLFKTSVAGKASYVKGKFCYTLTLDATVFFFFFFDRQSERTYVNLREA